MALLALYLVNEDTDEDLRNYDKWFESWHGCSLEEANRVFRDPNNGRDYGSGCQLRLMDAMDAWVEILAYQHDEAERRLFLLCNLTGHEEDDFNRVRVFAPNNGGLMFGTLLQVKEV